MTRVKEFALPDLGEGLTEGEILKWLVSVGDTVTLNQPIVEVETAKAAVEIPAKWAGQVTRIFHNEGETVEVGNPIIAIDTEPWLEEPPTPDAPIEPGLIGGPAPGGRTAILVGYGPKTVTAKRRPRATATGVAAGEAERAEAERVEAQRVEAQRVEAAERAAAEAVEAERVAAVSAEAERVPVERVPVEPVGAQRVLAKPPVRKLARDLGIDLTTLAGSGPDGVITRDDVLGAHAAPAKVEVVAPAVAAPVGGADQRIPVGGADQRIPVKGVRKLTAANMVASAFTAPHVTEFLTIDMTRSVRALDRLRARPDWREVRVSPLLLVAKAVLVALRRYPLVNSSWAGEEIIVRGCVNLGIAAATERGLIVPNIKDAGALSLRGLADAMTGLVTTAKAGRTTPADLTGGTFTITNVGVFGVDTGTPILPPGEAAILAFGAVREAPWVHRGKIKVRQVTTLGLSFDHRIIDGELGSKFLRDVGSFLTDPEAALLAWC